MFRPTKAPDTWQVKPWIFAPESLKPKIEGCIAAIPDLPFDYKWTPFEDIVPWKRPHRSAMASAEKRTLEAAE